MVLLILGLALFIGGHLVTTTREFRASLIARLGEGGYKGLYSVIALAGIALIAIGFGLVAPVLPASKARPDRDPDRVVAERGWIDAADLEALTGESRPPTLGRWVIAPAALAAMEHTLRARVAAAPAIGLEVAALDERERALLGTLAGITVEGGHARPAEVRDPLADHPFLLALEAGGVAPPDPTGVDRGQLREMVRRGLVVERDGLAFHSAAITKAALTAAALVATHPDGFTMSQFREALGITRKHALPLANELDARGITRRRGDVRIAGPKLPDGSAG